MSRTSLSSPVTEGMGQGWGVKEGGAVERVTVSLTRPADLVVDVDMYVRESLTQGLLGKFHALSVTLVSASGCPRGPDCADCRPLD